MAKSIANDIDGIALPDLGDSSGRLISPAQEKQLGDAFFRSLHRRIQINQDSEIQEYIQAIGRQLVANSDAPSNPFHFFVVIDKQINAFAGPGGYIGINSGLILLSESESELAAVMAHEVAHVTQRHLYRAFEAASQLSLPTAAATLAAILLGTQSPELGQAALIAIQAGNTQFQIDFTRDNEKEADRVGIQTLVRSNFNPRSMPVFFERLQQSSRFYGSSIPEFLRTHPVSASRISDTRGRADKFPYKQFPDSTGYLLAKAKLKVLTESNLQDVEAFFQLRQKIGTKEQKAIARYGLGLTKRKLQLFKDAEQIFQELQNQYPNQPHYAYALAKTAFEARQYKKAQKRYKLALHRFPNNDAIKIEYISTLLKNNQPSQAKRMLQNLSYEFQNQPLYYELLAKAYAGLKKPAESHRYLAEYYYSVGNTENAILQIQLAKKANNINFYLLSILNNRLSLFMEEHRQRQQEK